MWMIHLKSSNGNVCSRMSSGCDRNWNIPSCLSGWLLEISSFPKACRQSQVSHVSLISRLLLGHTLRVELRPPVGPDGTRGTGWGRHEMASGKGCRREFFKRWVKPKNWVDSNSRKKKWWKKSKKFLKIQYPSNSQRNKRGEWETRE